MALDNKTYNWDTPVDTDEFYTDDFVSWIDSINGGWRERRLDYEPFNLYVKEATEWFDDKTDINDLDDQEFKVDYIRREVSRIKRNSLYYLNKYHVMPDGDEEDGKLDYIAHRAHEVICYLFDMKISCVFGKPRQIWFSSTFGGLIAKRTCFLPNYSSVYMTDLHKKAVKTINEKVFQAYNMLPDWLRPNGKFSENEGTFYVGMKGDKKAQGLNSVVESLAPSDYSATGFAPNCSYMDEIGLNKNFGNVIKEIEPSMFKFDHKTGKLKRARQMMAWGTGGNMDKGGTAMEEVWRQAKNAWHNKDKSYALIAVFFDAYARPGMNEELYEKLKRQAYETEGVEREDKIAKFHMHYPLNETDMFRRGKKTILSSSVISKHETAAKNLDEVSYGYMEPIYDVSRPYSEDLNLNVPYRVIGATFVPTEGIDDERTSVVIRRHPCHITDKTDMWQDRYFKGTDPINSESGHSKMSTAIWDSYNLEVSAGMFYRVQDYRDVFLQSLLLGLYYDRNIKDLCENNTGTNYMDYTDTLGLGRILVASMELPPKFQINSKAKLGIPNRVGTNKYIIYELEELLNLHIDRVELFWFWEQLKSFVQKDLSNGQTRYQADDLKYHYDDMIFSITFAYICSKAFERSQPKRVNEISGAGKITTKMVMNAQTNWTPKLAQVDSNGNILKFVSHRRGL